jgi:general secretion pathway protein J
MSCGRDRAHQDEAGFTLFEALVAVALMGLILGALATVTAQWLPAWNRGLLRTQRNEQVAIALDRLVTDLSAADYVSLGGERDMPLFQGAKFAVTFVRSAVGPNGRSGLEIIRIAEIRDSLGPALVRMRAPFVPFGDAPLDAIPFAEPVVLLRAPFRISLAYAGTDGVWADNWPLSGMLPTTVRFDIRDSERDQIISTAARTRVDLRAPRPDSNQVDTGPAQPNDAAEAR